MIIALISCRFSYCLLVVGSESMTGAINKGDAIIYEAYDNQVIEEGDIIVFDKGRLTYIHRVVRIENTDGQVRYITKGDANESEDVGYATSSEIIGIHRVRINFIGYPTLWINSIFDR